MIDGSSYGTTKEIPIQVNKLRQNELEVIEGKIKTAGASPLKNKNKKLEAAITVVLNLLTNNYCTA